MAENFANNYQTSLDGAIDSSQSTLTLASATGAPTAPFRLLIGSEIVYVGTRSGVDCSDCERGAESTTAASHSGGAAVTDILTAAALNEFSLFHKCVIVRAAAQSIPDNAATQVEFDTEVIDVGGLGDVANYRIVIQRAGHYWVYGWWRTTDLVANGAQLTRIYNGATLILSDQIRAVTTVGDFTTKAFGLFLLAAGDLLTMNVLQNDGAPMNTDTAVDARPTLGVFEVK